MRIIAIEQQTPAWEQIRIGIPTASGYHRILTPAKLQLASSWMEYRNELLASWLLGYPLEFGNQSPFRDQTWMDRGKQLEAEAIAFYEMKHNVDCERVGFMMRDDEETGGSPDALVGDDGGAEIKCPSLHVHIGYMMQPDTLVAKYKGQTQGYIYLSDRAWWDVISYCPGMPTVIQRVERDEAYCKALHANLEFFIAELKSAKERLQQYRAPARAA